MASVATGELEMEAAMSIITACSRGHRFAHWGESTHVLGEWWKRVRSRNELESLDDCLLRDIGFSRSEVGIESSKTFWMV